ncbi:MAG: phosphatase PAP2 family protein [Sphaerochaeta sp.]
MAVSKGIRTVLLSVFLSVVLGSPLSATNWLDETFKYPYSASISAVSDLTLALCAVSPASFALVAPASDWLEIGVGYSGTMLASYGTGSVLKSIFERERPYVSLGGGPSDASDDYESFPSRHTLMAFSSAAYTQALFMRKYPDSPYRKAVTTTTWALSATTAVLRVVSGNHYVSDVLVGAAIGSALGFAGPYLTSLLFKDKENSPQLYIGPTVVAMRVEM